MIIERRGSAKNRAKFASSANSLALLPAFTGALNRPTNAQSTILAAVFVEYTLFSGTDAMMARKLMNLGIPVNVGTVESYRRLLIKSKGLETDTFDFYLETMRRERKRSKKERQLQGVATQNDYESDS